jgi:very-short-patch-repair endonuclease
MRILDLRDIRAVLDAHPHRHGAAKVARAIAEYEQGPVLRSILERDFLALCHRYRLPIPYTNHTLGPYEADFHWPEHRLIAETDGRAHHARRKAFTKDRVRDAELLVEGWRTVRFTHAQVVHQTAWVAGILRRALTRAGRA